MDRTRGFVNVNCFKLGGAIRCSFQEDDRLQS